MKEEMQITEKIVRALTKTAQKLSMHSEEELSDIHLRVIQGSGELMVFDDMGRELHRCVVESWINNEDENFYVQVEQILKRIIVAHKDLVEGFYLLKPFSLVLQNENEEDIAELYIVDDELLIFDTDLMKGLNEDLDEFLSRLLKD